MRISLVIPAYNEHHAVGACIEMAQRNSRGKIKEIIVVDNASTDRTAEAALEHPGVRVLHESRRGTNNARQTGAEAAEEEFIAFLDADTLIPEHWIDAAEKAFADPEVVMLSGPYRYYGSPWYRRWALDALWWTSPTTYFFVGYMALGGNIVVRKSAFDSINGFDRSLKFYGDDTDLARRMHAVGKMIWRMDFFVYTSARRFEKQGFFKTNILYVLNYFWPVIFGRPYTKTHLDIRTRRDGTII